MKTHTTPLTLLTIAGVSLITLSGAFSQQATPANPPVGSHQKAPKTGKHHKKYEAMLQNLTDAEKAQLKAARKQIHGDPQLVAARQAVKDAQTKEARETAIKAKHQLKRELLLKADPSIQPVLDKLTVPPGKPAA